MIECTTEYVWYKKRHRRFSLKRCFIFLIIIAIFSLTSLYYYKVTCPYIYNVVSNKIKEISNQSVNVAIVNSLNQTIKYSELVVIEKDQSGNIVYLSVDSLQVNSITREVLANCKVILTEKLNAGIKIPLLAFTGIDMLGGYGSLINFKSITTPITECDFDSKFLSSGINQTLHSIYLIVKNTVYLDMPFYKKEIIMTTKILFTENIIVGKIPEIYLKENLFNSN